ncbi:MAG TPA: glycoside hydrolase 43 family protein [Candidatus Bacteroides avicola]|mgnify:FL=1|jgi:beta-xylosidase|uniref:Glycoside hydrolase 43 family protein n=1 Tax=Candidatus Bacteroides avicola TaxID=2838468 RepID=A0A9D2HVA0_9BACE|nr:glycoside hydrolase 43 family protein [Candidatus Bacteroides avicola]
MKIKSCIVAGALLWCPLCLTEAQQVWSPDNGDGSFTNPLLWGDWPDPDVIRVEDTFYMVSTSMHYVPGSPILKSKDLVNWEMAGYAVERYDEDPRYDMQGGTLYLNGSWANSIRYHNGKFYVAFCTPGGWGTEKGHFSVCEAEQPEGPWTRTIFPEYLYDPGLFFDDDGKVYVVHGQYKLYVTELNPDVKSVKSKPVEIWNKGVDDARCSGKNAGMEGAHVYKINGMYYILCPAGGTEGWQVCLRSKNIYGPYEHKVVIQDDSSYPPNGLHQGGMVQLENGDWWFIIMQDRGAIGRVPHLLPVCWTDGWPMLGSNGHDVAIYRKPDTGVTCPIQSPATTDEFEDTQLGLQWQWNHNPDNSRWSLKERKGYMRLKASQATDLTHARNTLTQRVQGPLSTGTVEMDIAGLKEGNVAGFGIFQSPYAYLAVKQKNGVRQLVVCHNGKTETVADRLTQDKVWLRARVTDKDFTARLYYSLDGANFLPAGEVLHMDLGYPWTANRFALFNFSETEEGVGGMADFNWFRFYNK